MSPTVAQLRAAVVARAPVDMREAMSVTRFVRALDQLAAPLDEDADPTHVTGSAIVVGPRGVLLHRHKRLGIWLQPGGHLQRGEAPWEAALRETVEETGVAVTHPPAGPSMVHVDVHAAPRGHTHLDVRYLLHAGDVAPAPPVGESQAVAWFAWADAVALADPALVGALLAVRPPGEAGCG